ncbi:hypothetical protein OROMI_021143 [Orobanche minor]
MADLDAFIVSEGTASQNPILISSLPKNISSASSEKTLSEKAEDISSAGEDEINTNDVVSQSKTVPSNIQNQAVMCTSGNPSSAMDLGRYIFPNARRPSPSNRVDGSAPGSKSPVFASVPCSVFGGFPEINGSGPEKPHNSQIMEGSSSLVSNTAADGTRNLLKNLVPQKSVTQNPMGVRNPIVQKEPVARASPVSVNELRDALSPEMLARFPESTWNEAAVIVAEILKIAPPGGSKPIGLPTGAPPQSPAIEPPSEPLLSSGQLVSFADAVIGVRPVPVVPGHSPENPVAVDGNDPDAPLGMADLSGNIPTAVFSKEDADQVSAVFKFALIGKFSYGKPDAIEIRKHLQNSGFGM